MSELMYIGLSFIILFLMGLPIAFVLGLSALGYILFYTYFPLQVIAQQLYGGIDSFVLLAIPFFILAGHLMNETGISDDLVKFADLLVGKLPGSLAQINIATSILFAGLTGAAVADSAAIGSLLIPAMKKEGYKADYAAAVTAASSIIGPIIPPSIVMVIYGAVTDQSIGALFLAGIIPGFLIGIALMILATIYALKENHPRRRDKIHFKQAIKIIRSAFLALIAPAIIVGGITTGIFTPTEAAAVACLYAFIIGILVYKNLSIKTIFDAIEKTAIQSAVVLFIISTAKLFGYVITIERVPEQIAQLIVSFTNNKYVFLMIINIFLLFVGMIMETGASIIILAPILQPIAASMGIDPLHFAMVMLINLCIGLSTPPLGVCLFTVAPIANEKYEKIAVKILPFIIVEIIVLILITYFPEIILYLPNKFNLN